jgi:hypothetical protein
MPITRRFTKPGEIRSLSTSAGSDGEWAAVAARPRKAGKNAFRQIYDENRGEAPWYRNPKNAMYVIDGPGIPKKEFH